MQIAYIVVPAIVLGAILTIFGAGPIGLVLIIVAVIAVAVRSSGAFSRHENEPRPGLDNEPGPGIGYAHKGQKHMTPEQF